MPAEQIYTRFRAYQLDQAGSSFSYFANGKFTLIDAKHTDLSRISLAEETQICGVERINTLHITSWDQDHCSLSNLEEILDIYQPSKVEYPGYVSDTDNGQNCKEAIIKYETNALQLGRQVNCVEVSPLYIDSLKVASELGYKDILYWPKWHTSENSNDNSLVKLFRGGSFNVVSLGDVEDVNIASYLRRRGILKTEIDVLILAHHGSDCPTNSKNFFEILKPKVAICSSNYANHFDHPRPEVRDRLFELGIPLYTTKTGDVIIESLPPHDRGFRVTNLKGNSSEISSQKDFASKKFSMLSMNMDSLKNLYKGRPAYRRFNS